MRAEIHPAARRITWLTVIIGAVAVITAILYLLLNLGPGIALPFTRTLLDTGWLLIFGLLWLVVGVLMLWWLRPVSTEVNDNGRQFDQQLAQIQTAQNAQISEINTLLKRQDSQLEQMSARLTDLEKALKGIQLEVQNEASKPRATVKDSLAETAANHLRDLDNELGSLATTIQDAHTRLDTLGDVNSRLHELETQLDDLYVTLQDAHRRIDGLEQVSNP